jgi:ABC-2 type transport system permease protein
MAVDVRAPLVSAPASAPWSRRIWGFGSVFGKTLRDSRFAVVAVVGVLGLMVVAGGATMANTYGTPETRRELAELSASLPPVLAGLYGNPVSVDILGGFISWHYGTYLALLGSLWSILALSSTLAGEARRGSLEFTVATPLSRTRIALEKLGGHVVAVAVAMALVGLAAWVAGAAFGTMPGDEVSPEAAAGFAVGLFVRTLMAGSVAFALASFVGRGIAAGLAGALLVAGYVVTSYRTVVPVFDAVAEFSWFAWTSDHLPLAGRWDWAAVMITLVAVVVLLGIGIVGFARRDLGVTGSIRTPTVPGTLLGLRGPIGRSFGEVLPMSLAWGIGVGLYALLMAAASRSFVEELQGSSIIEVVRDMVPGIDLTTPEGFLQMLFVDFGLVLVGLAAATLVAERMGDETAGRLELQLTTPLTRARWALASGAGVWLGLAVVVACLALAVVVGVTAAGGEAVTPLVGTLALALYGLALTGIGIAVGGLFGSALAGPVVVVFAIGTFLVDILGPALDLPDWVQQLALSSHMGEPMVGSWDANGIVACLVVALGGLVLGAWGIRRRDVSG